MKSKSDSLVGSLVSFRRLRELLKDPLRQLRIDADSRILHINDNPGIAAVEPNAYCAVVGKLDRVRNQIRQDTEIGRAHV